MKEHCCPLDATAFAFARAKSLMDTERQNLRLAFIAGANWMAEQLQPPMPETPSPYVPDAESIANEP